MDEILSVLPPSIAAAIRSLPASIIGMAQEIRLRVGQPVLIVTGSRDIMVSADGRSTELTDALKCNRDDLARTIQMISRNSLYAFEQELRSGYFTIAGGHRIGIAGQAITEDGRVKSLKNIASVNIRIARELPGIADMLLPWLLTSDKRVMSTLIISPPRCGKTTLLRDIVRKISTGCPSLNFNGLQVGLVDERSEIAACQNGVPTMNLGPRVDVLDGCPKAQGLLMLIRSMGPQVVATDELGREEDTEAVCEALHAGVSIIATVHGGSVADISRRPHVGELLNQACFERYIILANYPETGSIDQIINAPTAEVLFHRSKGVRICG